MVSAVLSKFRHWAFELSPNGDAYAEPGVVALKLLQLPGRGLQPTILRLSMRSSLQMYGSGRDGSAVFAPAAASFRTGNLQFGVTCSLFLVLFWAGIKSWLEETGGCSQPVETIGSRTS